MKPSKLKISPELQGLLGEIAAQDGGQLLQFNPSQARKALYHEGPGSSVQAALLTNPERQLLRVHRVEVGRLLYQQASVLLRSDSTFGDLLVRSAVTREQLSPSGRAKLDQQSMAAAQGLTEQCEDQAAELLMKCCARGSKVEAADLLRARMRIDPTDTARVHLALALKHDRHADASRELLLAVLASGPDSMIASYAWENIGLLESVARRHAEAAQAYALASEDGRIGPLLSLFTCHLHLGQSSDLMAVAARIDEATQLENETTAIFIHDCEAAKRRGQSQIIGAARGVSSQVLDKLGTVSNAIAHACL